MGKSEIRGKKDVYIADDIAVLAKDKEGMKGMMDKLEKYLDEIGMELKTGKTKIMKCRKGGVNRRNFIGGREIEEVKEFKYLGYVIRYIMIVRKCISEIE